MPHTSCNVQGEGFSESIIDRFFRPFLSGTFFDPKLGVTSRTFELIMRAFAVGPNCIPANGMQAVADQLAEPLVATGSVFLNSPVATVKPAAGGSPASVVLGSGITVTASKCVDPFFFFLAFDSTSAMLGRHKALPSVLDSECTFQSATFVATRPIDVLIIDTYMARYAYYSS